MFVLNWELKIKHLNASEHWHFTLYYDDESKEKVADFFKEDIKFLGYRFGRQIWTGEWVFHDHRNGYRA